MIFTWFYVTHVSILTSDILNASLRLIFFDLQNVLLPLLISIFDTYASRRFGDSLELRYIFGAFKHRPVSYYAFIIRWLLPSLLPGCYRLKTSFPTQRMLWNLSVRSGLFPSWLWTFAPIVCLYFWKKGIRSFLGFSKALGHPYPMSALPPFFF